MSSGVEFEGDNMKYTLRPSSPGSMGTGSFGEPSVTNSQSKMVGWLMRHGIVKSPGVAQGVLVGVVIINIIITYIVTKYLL